MPPKGGKLSGMLTISLGVSSSRASIPFLLAWDCSNDCVYHEYLGVFIDLSHSVHVL